MAGTINDITNLKFYTAKGYEIPMKKSYVLTWEFIPGRIAKQYMKVAPTGYFIADIDLEPTSDRPYKIRKDTLQTAFINPGEVYVRFASTRTTDANGFIVYGYNEINPETNQLPAVEYYNYLMSVLSQSDNKVKVSINIKNESFTHVFNATDIFDFIDSDHASGLEKYTTITTVYTGNNLVNSSNDIVNSEFYQTIGISKIDLKYTNVYQEDEPVISMPYIQMIFEEAVPNIGLYFPFVRYSGDFYQDRISSDFIASDTILVLEEVRNEDDTFNYVKPYITANSEYSLVFQPTKDSEIKIIDGTSEYEIKYKPEAAFAMSNDQEQIGVAEPFSFAIAFQASEEGAYQNLLGIYLRSQINENIVFFMGALSIKTEVEGEDERFRTLLTNFGLPDPVQYPNIFAESDFSESGKDYELINKKSKELMLTYDQIFSYVGTYKALIRAIKFLGYQDIIFKEWYTIKDQNDKMTDIAVQVFDASNGSFLKQKLADFGISMEDFRNYNKLNKISMIYHFNQKSDEVEKIRVARCHYDSSYYDPSNGKIVVDDYRTFISEVPMTQPMFIYRDDEIMAKLYAVKKWLEQHIIGVGAYISDITGEGIYFCWQKTQGYSTQHYLNDFSQEQYYTPDVKAVLPFIESKGKIACTLNELNNAVRFEDYDEVPIDAFDRYDISINLRTDDNVLINSSVLTLSNSIEAPVLGDEYEFDLTVKPDSGTLYEWSAKDSSSQILIQDGEIKLLFDKDTESYIDSSCLPIITLENANIHNAYGNWRSNIKWMIREGIDASTGNSKYVLKNYQQFLKYSMQKVVNQYFVLEPNYVKDSSGNIVDMPYIKYSEKNKWDIPMFIIHGYKFANVSFDPQYYIGIDPSDNIITIDEHDIYNLEDTSSNFILEILKGDMLFKDIDGCGCQLSFTADNIKQNENSTYVNEQEIHPAYTYHSDRVPFVSIDSSAIMHLADSVVNCSQELQDVSNQLTDSVSSIYGGIVNNLYNYNSGVSYQRNVAAIEAENFLDSCINYQNDVNEFIQVRLDALRQEILDSSLDEIIANNYKFNRTIDVEVTRLGKYEMITRAFDRYNNTFTAKYDNEVEVTAAPIPIDTYINSEKSNNEQSFYSYNIDGSLQSASQVNDIISSCNKYIEFPETYPIYNIDYNLENNNVEFDNISYALDTPKNNNYVIFNTLTERCVDISINNGSTRLMMLDENPNKNFLYANIENKKLSVFAYNPITKGISYSVEKCNILDSSLADTNTDNNYNADSYLVVDGELTTLKNNYLNDQYKLFVLNTTEYPLIFDPSFGNVSIYYDTRKSVITFNYDQVFNKEDVIKIRYYMDVSLNSSLCGKIINETAYRIIDVNGIDQDPSTMIYGGYEYTINGIPNTNLLENPNVQAYITYAAHCPVQYTSKIIGDGFEYNHVIGYENYSILVDQFKFNSKQLFLDDYIDDTYGIEIVDFDYDNGRKYFLDFTQFVNDSSNMNLYYYHQFPTTITQGDNAIFRAHNSNNTFKEGYKKQWKVSVSSIDELTNIQENINTNKKEVLFKSINEYLTMKPYMLGSHDIQLECTDIYGNRLVNKGEGLLFVNHNENGMYDNYSYI